MITPDLQQMSHVRLSKAFSRGVWSRWRENLARGCGLAVAWVAGGLWRMWLRGWRLAGLDGCGLPVTPVHFGIASP